MKHSFGLAALLAGGIVLASCQPSSPEAEEAGNAANSVEAEAEAPAPAATPPEANTALPPTPPVTLAPPAPLWSKSGYRLVGTEPFWGGTVSRDRIVYQTPEDPDGEAIAVMLDQAADRETYSGTLNGAPFILMLTKAGPCSDGMSDRVYLYTATLKVAGETRSGCASPQ